MPAIRATLLHFALGALVLAGVLAVIMLAWYPGAFLHISGVHRLLLVIVGICLLAGPLLTLVVFKPGKKGLRFDLWVIAGLQVVALAYTLHVVWQQRPYFLVFGLDRFNVVTRHEVDLQQVGAAFRDKPWRGPVLAVARMPTSQAAREQLMEETLFLGMPDIERRPALWVTYDEGYADIRSGAPSALLLKELRPDTAGDIDRLAERSGTELTNMLFVPVMGRTVDHVLLLRKQDGQLLGAVNVGTWPE